MTITNIDTSGLNFLDGSINDYGLFRFWEEALKIDLYNSEVVLWEVNRDARRVNKSSSLVCAASNSSVV
jgi:hypothetical protein